MKLKVIRKNNLYKMLRLGMVMFTICVILDGNKMVECIPTPSTATLQSSLSLANAMLPSTDQYGNVIPGGNPSQNTKIIDMNNPDQTILSAFGLSNENLTALKQKQNDFKAKNNRLNLNGSAPLYEEPGEFKRNDTVNPSIVQQTQYEQSLLKSIRDGMEQILLRNTSNQPTRPIPSDVPTHEISVYPICGVHRNTNDTVLANSDTWNLHYTPPATFSNRFVSTAILRLFKIIPLNDRRNTTTRTVSSGQMGNSNATDCSPPNDDLIRITISAYMKKNRKERRKRMCSSIMVSKSYIGWIDLDVKSALKLWEKPNRNLGLAVDIQDQDENILHASDYFVQADCATNQRAIPWNFYKEQLAYNATQMEQLPRYPRLDVQVIDFPMHPVRHFQHHHHHHHHRRINTNNDYYQMDDLQRLRNQLTSNEATTIQPATDNTATDIQFTTSTATLNTEHQTVDQLKMHKKRHLQKNHYLHLYHQLQEHHRLQQRQSHHNAHSDNTQQQHQQHHNIPLNYQHHQHHYHQQNNEPSAIMSNEDYNESYENDNTF